MKIHNDLTQGTDEWLAVRRGMLTASTVGTLITSRTLSASEYDCPKCGTIAGNPCVSVAKGQAGTALSTVHPMRSQTAREVGATVIEPARTPESKALATLLAAERITGRSDERRFVNFYMERGIEDEPVVRDLYADIYNVTVEQVGFITEAWAFGEIGYSPDGLVGQTGLIEIKSVTDKKMVSIILADEVPREHMGQCQAGLLVSGRKWLDYIAYRDGLPLFVKRVLPDPDWQQAIIDAAEAFEGAVSEMVRSYEQRAKDMHMTEVRQYDLEIV